MITWSTPVEDALDCFPPDYAAARAAFLSATKEAGGSLASFPVAGRGPEGEALSIDAAWVGPSNANAVLVMLSGTHGVEGFVGSAAQADVLRHAQVSDDLALLLVHALTPWGFAWCDRTDNAGIDLNRNFVDHNSPPPNPGYDQIARAVAPTDSSVSTLARCESDLAAWRAEHGEAAFRSVCRAGQYRHPGGLYFGGTAPAAGRLALETLFQHHRMADRQVAVVDWHTGLGPFGHGELQSELPPEAPLFRLAQSVFGPELVSPFDGTSSSTVLNGTMQDGLFSMLGDRPHVYVCLEFGTYGPDRARRILAGLAQLRAGIAVDGDALRTEARAFFFPDTPGWNEMALWRGRQVMRHLAAWLARSGVHAGG